MKRPGIIHALSEPMRASGEYATSFGLMPFHRFLPDGDGHPILVLPGFMASDRSTTQLRRLLRRLGYETHPWGLGRNIGPTERVVDELPRLLEGIGDRSGRRVSLVGWSLGGVYARHLAASWPSLVRFVVTLGTPVRREVQGASNASVLYDSLRAVHVPGHLLLDDGAPLEVPVTAVHTRADGIVHWETCLVRPASNAENLRVRGSHIGLGYNPAVSYLIADRLAQTEDDWQPFEPGPPYGRVITVVD